MIRVLVTGTSGQLGRDVVEAMRSRCSTVGLTHRDLDITRRDQVREVFARVRPDVVVNCAAYTQVDRAEAERAQAFEVNALGVQQLALACQEHGAVLVQISTDYVFDGYKNAPYRVLDRPNPINVYGESKLLGELYTQWLLGRYFIVRTSWLYGSGASNFVEAMLRLGAERRTVEVVTDQVGALTYTADLAQALVDLVGTSAYGVYHVTNQGAAGWHEIARQIFSLVGWDVTVRPTTAAALGRPAPRPANSQLDPFPLQETIGYLLPPWEDALARYLTRRGVRHAEERPGREVTP